MHIADLRERSSRPGEEKKQRLCQISLMVMAATRGIILTHAADQSDIFNAIYFASTSAGLEERSF